MIYWIIHISILLILSYLLFKELKSDMNSLVFWGALVYKLIAGVVLGLVYFEYYQGGDTIRYFEMASSLAKQPINQLFLPIEEAGNQNRLAFFVKIVSLLCRFTGHSYWLSSLYISFTSFLATTYFIVVFSRLYPELKTITAIIFYFIPSIVFWNAGVTKDAVSFALFTFLITLVIKKYGVKKIHWFELFVSLISILILIKIKHYALITFILFAGLLAILWLSQRANKWIGISLASIVLLSVFLLTQNVHPYLNLGRLPLTLYEVNQTIIEKTDPDKQIGLALASADWEAVISKTPHAIFIGLFKPNLLDPTIHFGWFHRVENFLLLCMATFSVILLIRNKSLPKNFDLVLASLISIIFLATFLSLSTPNYGSLVRYKSIYMPFLMLLCCTLPYKFLKQTSLK